MSQIKQVIKDGDSFQIRKQDTETKKSFFIKKIEETIQNIESQRSFYSGIGLKDHKETIETEKDRSDIVVSLTVLATKLKMIKEKYE